ncbi:MAG: penicillin-binding protein 2 [Melioribacteraceae bacterium]|nr:penicillin-binding protein 2 [Melioribacteraceae bacterium]
MQDNHFGSLIRRRIIYLTIVGFFIILVFQLMSMQLLNRSAYEEKSNENSIKTIVRNPPRGIFFDRNLNFLVGNKASFTLEIIPDTYNKERNEIIEKVIAVEADYINQILKKNKRYSKYLPRKIKRNIQFNAVAWLEENSDFIPGVNYIVEMQRDYSFGVNASHVFGYTKEIDFKTLGEKKDIYKMGDYIGYNGVEKTYENFLRGNKGKDFYVVDSRQKIIGKYESGNENILALKGNDLVLTIDRDAQIAAENSFHNMRGALVAIEPSTGEILALVSAPQYDLSKFASVTSNEIWNELSRDTTKPLFNRATMSRNPPGSTFKMMIAIAALEDKIITTSDYVTCGGGFLFGDKFFKCTHVHGKVNVVSAIERSCNTFFYQLMLKIGIERLSKYGKMFGFGRKTNIDIGEESSGILPNKAYYDRVYGKGKWTRGYLVSLGIGQGELITTPLQLAQYTSLLANFGVTKSPHLVKGYIENETNNYIPFEFEELRASISKETFDIVREGMYKVVNGNGTATLIRLKDIKIAGKTGTAQNPHGEDHALFIGFAPFENPQIAVAVIVENIGYGSTYAAPIVKKVIEAYLNKHEYNAGELLSNNL